MTQTPHMAPAGWYPSPDGAPVLRWWEGTLWTDATRQPSPPASDEAPFPQAWPPVPPSVVGPVAHQAADGYAPTSGWPAPEPPRLQPWSTLARVLVVLAGVAGMISAALRLWRTGTPPDWLTDDVAMATTGAAGGLFALAGIAWCVWQFRVAASVPPGTTQRTPSWHLLSWVVPVGNVWLPLGNLRDLVRLATGTVPRWLFVWWGLWLAGWIVAMFETVWPWAGVVGAALVLAAAPLAMTLVGRITSARGPQSEQMAP